MQLPLIGSDLSGIPEIVREGESGLLVEPGDVDGIRRALITLASSPETRRTLGAGARAIIEAQFNGPQNVARLREAFLRDEAAT